MDAAPILYRYSEVFAVNTSAEVVKTGETFNGSSTLRSKETFSESDHGTVQNYRGLEQQDGSLQNNLAITYVPIQTQSGGITQTITHTKPAADNTITIPNQGTNTTVAPGGEVHTDTSTQGTHLTVQKPMADFVDELTTETAYTASNPNTSSDPGVLSAIQEQTPGFRQSMFTVGPVPNRALWESLDTFTPSTSLETNALVAAVFVRSLGGWVFTGEEAIEDHVVRSGMLLYFGDEKGFVDEQKNITFGYADKGWFRELLKSIYIDVSNGNITTIAEKYDRYGAEFERELRASIGTQGFKNGQDAAPLIDFIIMDVGTAFIPGGAVAKGAAKGTAGLARGTRLAPVKGPNLPILNPHFTPRQFTAAELQAKVAAEFQRLSVGMSKNQIHNQIGPAMSIAQDSVTGELSFIYKNLDTVPPNLSSQIASKMSSVPRYHDGVRPGLHAEIWAANELLVARPGMTIRELRIFTMETKMSKYLLQVKPPCPHCGHLLDGATFLQYGRTK